MEWLFKSPIAHRGLHKGFIVPENSMAAFKKALQKGYGIELDVRVTKDRQVVVYHDKNLSRVSQSKKKIKNNTYAVLKTFSLYQTTQKIPLLSEVLELVDGQVPIVIEMKNYEDVGIFEEAVYDVVKEYKGDFAVCSFNPKVLEWFSKNKPDIKKGLIFGDIKKFEIKYYNLLFLYRYLRLKPDFVSLDYRLIDTFIVKICRFFKVPIVSWTVDGKRKNQKALTLVDNVIFEGFKPKVLY